jgi:FAD/FMN-containing dehydrogenase
MVEMLVTRVQNLIVLEHERGRLGRPRTARAFHPSTGIFDTGSSVSPEADRRYSASRSTSLEWKSCSRYPERMMATPQPTGDSRVESTRIGAGHPQYVALLNKRFNKRFIARPDYIRPAASTKHVLRAVQEAVNERQRLVVTSGGHCLEGFVSDPDVRVIIDVSPMKRIYYDPEHRAIAVEAGATVGETFQALFEAWGTVIPLGEYPGIGMGGHVVGGAFGFLCRQLGLAADYLYAVEVVTVDEAGRASSVVATRETSDLRRELWWAHTGAGGGNFGVVTRYWFRAPDASGDDPATLLPRAPQSITTFKTEWNWNDIDGRSFERLLRNHGLWSEQHSGADSPNTSLWTLLELHRKQFGKIIIRGLSTAGDAAERQVHEYLASVFEGVQTSPRPEQTRMAWLDFALNPFPDLFAMPPGGVYTKMKDALLKKRFTDDQIGIAYDYLTRTDHDVMGGMLGLATYGGRVNTVAPDATASPQRHAIFDLACMTGWLDPREEAQNMAWVRTFYRDLFATTGGAPVPGDAYDGAMINHPDVDLADQTLNNSGVPWHALYYQSNYPRLQRIKAQWDPQNVFRHTLSIRAED